MTRHRWSAPNRPSRFKTERECQRCGLIKVTRHEGVGGPGESYWTEWWRPDASGVPARIDSENMPACAPVSEEETTT